MMEINAICGPGRSIAEFSREGTNRICQRQSLAWGSRKQRAADKANCHHREVFRLLRRVCRGRMVFHNRLDLSDLQGDAIKASRLPDGVQYDAETIVNAAADYFHVQRLDCWMRVTDTVSQSGVECNQLTA